MRIEALVCVKCGGPLGGVTSVPTIVECEFCGATITVGQATATLTREGSTDELRATKQRAAGKAFFDGLVALLQAGRSPYEALRAASAAHLGTAGQTEAVARVTLALATDFEREAEIPVLRDPLVLGRIALAYLQVIEKLGTSPEEEMSLPFIAASASGPKHFRRRVTAAQLAELALRDPHATAESSTTGAAAKKKKWWQFGG